MAIAYLLKRGLTAETDGEMLRVSPAPRLTDDDREYIKRHKAELVAEVQRRARRDELLLMLAENPGVRYAYAVDAGTDPVIVAIGIRDQATFEMSIPAERYDPWRLLALIDDANGADTP